jgi:cyanate lyase
MEGLTKVFAKLIGEAEKTADFQFERAVIDLTEIICAIMEEKDVSRMELAERLGKSEAWVTKVLCGDYEIALRAVVTILWELGYRIDMHVIRKEKIG